MAIYNTYARRILLSARTMLTGVVMLAIYMGVMTPVGAIDLLEKWQGVWFSCEFAQRQRAPDDGCAMFDDEGFTFTDGRLNYVRITESAETACRGEKIGQCFRSDRPSINIVSQDRGKLDMGETNFTVRFLGCKQLFHFKDMPDYREIWPDQNRCFWAGKRHFYIAPYNGNVEFADR